ncbi:hypothetical protein F5146DRAFT_558282 [Armillaria mellea]|nr:hypothetical protein F5146DRAFT_558282 [Armillaria mellea]
MRETKTAKAGTDCPTLLHYLARVLLRSNPSLVTFIEDLPNVEAASRLSVQTIMQSVSGMTSGLTQIKTEITQLKQQSVLPDDRFTLVMQPFVTEVEESIVALKNMGQSLEGDLHSLLAYYGENPDTPDAPKPEDFFGLILSFSSSLQKCALEVHDSQQKSAVQTTQPDIQIRVEVDQPAEPTIKAVADTQDSHGRTAGGKSVGRGDLDQAIRSMRDGKRRARPARPLSKIFLDGAPSGGRPQSRFLNHDA